MIIKEHPWKKAIEEAEKRGIRDPKRAVMLLRRVVRKYPYKLLYDNYFLPVQDPRLLAIENS